MLPSADLTPEDLHHMLEAWFGDMLRLWADAAALLRFD